MSELRNIPRLRFSDFNYEWTTDTLNSISNLNMGQSPNSSSYNQDEIGMPLIQGNADITNRKSKPRQWTTEPTKLCDDGDLIMTVRAPVGYISKSIHNACIGRGVCSIKPKGNNSIEFIYQFLLGYEKDWRRLEQGSTFTAVNSNDIKSIKLSFPSLPEQQKIADFLTSVDKRIELLEKKKTLLETYKKGVMKKIFNQEIRFKDDNGSEFPDWEEKKLGEICDYKNGGSFEKLIIESGEFNLITLNSIDIEGNMKNTHKRVNVNDNSLSEGDLIMVLSDVAHGNFLGLTEIIPNNKFVLNQRMGALKPKLSINRFYLKCFINQNQKYFKLMGQGSSQLNLSKGDILNFNVSYPIINEQEKISNFFKSVDNQIKLLKTHINKSKTWKKGLLQKMFV